MQVVGTIDEMRHVVADLRAKGQSIAFVPTMGALHEGHLTLIDEARRVADVAIMSIFVNPLQFGPSEDFDRYPRTLDDDAKLATERGVDFLFTPTREDMYPEHAPVVFVHPGSIGKEWEGAVRPHHFEGVLTVVAKLFHIVMPDVAVFGQKDLQQVAAVKGMVRDLNFPVGILVAPVVRDPDGLAMSSRNRYLSARDRELGRILPKALFAMRDAFARGERRASALEATGWRMLERVVGLTPRYLAVVNADTFQRVNNVRHGDAAVGAIRVGETKLIDNIIF
ncbi:MAG: pantoate--beta-alanine ligase [Gemmatimonadetes bacterium]|nr:MAG: pantoate--beta-alanine ligase [Gemmatimonadota bacterium]PYP50742.1 MAG: pantoate--beta-alanine ligase [Gemmatimonadota bacterium]